MPAGTTSLRLVYNNDPHEKFKALPHLVSAFRQLSAQGQAQGQDVLRLNAGDNNVGKEADEWALSVRLLNMLNYHAVTMGNHELDPGSRGYAEGLRGATFPTLLSNLNILPGSALSQRLQEGQLRNGPMVVQDRQSRYGLIGVTTPQLFDVLSKSAKLEGETPQSWEQTVATVQAQVNQLRSQGINKIVVLSHMGLTEDKQLAHAVSGIDVIMGGHSHDALRGITPGINYLSSSSGEPVLILQGGKNAQWLGVADVLFDAQGRVIPQRNELLNPYTAPPDPAALALRNNVLGVPRPIATMTGSYDGTDNEFHPDTVAQFAADALRAASNADIGFVRSPEVRNNFEPGTFTDQDLKALMPFTDSIVRLPLTGLEILNALHCSAQCLKDHNPHPGMLHPSGMSVAMNRKTGQVTQAYVFNKANGQWETLNPYKTYNVALGEFTVNGKEYPDLAHPDRVQWNSGQPLRAFFNWGLQQAGAPAKPITFHDDGRLQIS